MAKENNPYLSFEDDDLTNDFGFTFDDEPDLSPITDEVADLKNRLNAIRKIYMPLLENLEIGRAHV